ncbi:hypothetical protein LTR53_016890 [Teratosphaeriaceae sp. CCFEE 6253]|nr:hypothetical protein LTR53_016890 [Teratosphaeriaceae sp. CCFEE 6253]
MAPLDPTVAHTLDHADSSDEDDLIAALESDSEATLTHLREQRLQQLHAELAKAATLKELPGHGVYTSCREEKDLLHITTTTKFCVVHFMKPDFHRCGIMEAKLRVLAEKHYETRFIGVDVEDAPFVVARLGVQVLPCVMCFVDGVGRERILGFEGIGLYGGGVGAEVTGGRSVESSENGGGG